MELFSAALSEKRHVSENVNQNAFQLHVLASNMQKNPHQQWHSWTQSPTCEMDTHMELDEEAQRAAG